MVRSVAVLVMVLGSIGACSDPARANAVSAMNAASVASAVSAATIVSRSAIPVKVTPVHVPLVVVPITSAPIVERVQEPVPSQSEAPSAPSKTPKGGALNVNTASAAELEELPGIGPATAARIVEYRQKNGSFKKVEDLMNIRGIGEKSFLKLKPLITVTPVKADRGTGASDH
jgi:competence protein ComEA